MQTNFSHAAIFTCRNCIIYAFQKCFIIMRLTFYKSIVINILGSFSFSTTSLKHEFYGLMSGLTRLIMETKYVCNGLISLANFHDNWTKRTVTSNIKVCRWGGGGKEKEPYFDMQ